MQSPTAPRIWTEAGWAPDRRVPQPAGPPEPPLRRAAPRQGPAAPVAGCPGARARPRPRAVTRGRLGVSVLCASVGLGVRASCWSRAKRAHVCDRNHSSSCLPCLDAGKLCEEPYVRLPGQAGTAVQRGPGTEAQPPACRSVTGGWQLGRSPVRGLGLGLGAADPRAVGTLLALGRVCPDPRTLGGARSLVGCRGAHCVPQGSSSSPPSPRPVPRGADGHVCRLNGTAGDALLVSCCSFLFAGIFFFFLTAT